MKTLIMSTAKFTAIVLFLGLFTGCAYWVEIQKAQDAAAAAQVTADAADRKADQALQQAAQAKQAADECSARCDRMFQKSQAK